MNRHLYLLMDAGNELPASTLSCLLALLAKGRAKLDEAIFEPSLAQAFGIETEAYAAISWLGEGHDPEGYCWMYADPVHFSLQRDYFSLAYPAPLVLPSDENAVLLDAINKHFSEDGLVFCIGASGRWYLRTTDAPEISTTLPAAVAGRDVRAYQPQGPDAARWKRIMYELQMLLHQHPVNEAREARGELPVNSLWLSGQGRLPAHTKAASFACVYAQQPIARGLGTLGGAKVEALPLLQDYLVASTNNDLLVIDAKRPDCADWLRAMQSLVRAGKLERLTLSLISHDKILTARLTFWDAWKFWRRPKPLQSY
jgi:hypothetical protein